MAITQSKRASVQIPIIDYERIRSRDPKEVEKLFKACQSPPGRGAFFLDLRGPSTQQTLTDLPAVEHATVSYFKQPKNVKMADFREGIERGFKLAAEFEETFEISWDELNAKDHGIPSGLSQCTATASICDTITRDLLSVLCESLDLGKDIAPRKSSDTGLKLCLTDDTVKAWELTSDAHTDMGFLTLIFCNAPVIELADPDDHNTWQLIEPVEGCALVHVANALQQQSGGKLHSPLHRAAQPDGVGPNGTCLTAYYLRPEHPCV